MRLFHDKLWGVLGVTIGSYVIRGKLASGGMGTVYLAEHTGLDKRAAIKVLLPEHTTDSGIVARFFNEAKAASAIHHPSIVEIYDFGYTADGHAYIVMELLEGESLSSRLKRMGRLELKRAMLFARQIAGALTAVHERGIIHRDLKPDNVFVVPDPEVPGGERVKLLDFGIAKLHKDPGDTSVTQVGSVLGTPRYMAPEQCSGTGQVDARADLYALGCVLYELLVGRPPFTPEGAGVVMAHHLYFEVPPPRSIVPQLPEPIEHMVMTLLEKDPAKRFQSAADLVAAIDLTGFGSELTAPQPVAAPIQVTPIPTTLSGASGVRAALPVPRRTPWWVMPSVALVLIAAGFVGYSALVGHAEPSSEPAAPPAVATIPVAPPPATPADPAPPVVVTARHRIELAIDSDPQGATVLVNGKPIGKTPFVETLDVRAGQRAYTVQKPGYESATTTLPTDRASSQTIVLKKKRRAHPTTNHDADDRSVNPFD